jgi:AtzE family amidohydrolase
MKSAFEIAASVKSASVSAVSVARETIANIRAAEPALNCFTAITETRALAEAAVIDRLISRGEDPGPLAGVPFAVKNLFDIEGLSTLAGSRIRSTATPAASDSASVRALHDAGGVLIGALNMDEFAYGFTTENTHYGPTYNPHDLSRVAGGSSGGSAAAVAAGLLPLTMGSDTNGSIRVPAAFCGVFGLKPTYGRLSRAGAFLFSASLDHVGPFARTVEDLSLAYDALQGPDPADPVCAPRPADPSFAGLTRGAAGLRLAATGDYFLKLAGDDALETFEIACKALGTPPTISIPEAARARAAAYIITASEGGNHHLADLKSRAMEYDPMTRTRFLAGTLVPAAWVSFAQRFRSWYRERVRELFEDVDVIIAPATPCAAITIGQDTLTLDGKTVPSRPNLGVFTQPISFIGLPVVAVPIHRPGKMPMAVQLIGAPFQESNLLRLAWELQQRGIASAPVATQFALTEVKG